MGNNRQKNETVFDAIVVGSGISGGWAAKELCENGLKTLVIERGRPVNHITDYKTATLAPWEFPHHLQNTEQDRKDNPIQSLAYNEATKHFFVSDKDHPYIQEKPFHWIRGYQVGGKSLTWGRQCYRFSDLDFEANLKDGIGVDWPIRYKDIEPWYDYVEKFVGISGQIENIPHLPDGQFLPAMEMNSIEEHFKIKIKENYSDRIVTIGRVANLTKGWNGRGPCQFRNLCDRGCPFGGYFSSNAATLPIADNTGNLTLKTNSIVIEVIYNENTKKASGVRVIDAITKEITEYSARIIFLNASTIATTSILLNSTSKYFPTGLGNSSGQVGHNLMDHFIGTGAFAEHDSFTDKYYYGRRPTGLYIPRFRNIDKNGSSLNFLRGYGFQAMGSRMEWDANTDQNMGFGKDFKAKVLHPGPWTFWLGAWGETLPYYNNSISLDTTKKDQWGIPLVKIDFEYHDNEAQMRKDIVINAEEMLDKAGFKKINSYNHALPGGRAIHEMGTARMGNDPKDSVLNKFNQMHDVKNVFITDGSCMTSAGCQSPSLTYMALTARACHYAISQLKKMNL